MASVVSQPCQTQTEEYKQSSIVPQEKDHRIMDMMIEFFIHNNLTHSVAETLRNYPEGKLCQFRRCTLKAMVIHYAKTIIEMDEKSKLVMALSTLEKLFADHAVNDKRTMQSFHALQRQLRYQIVVHHLESCGAQSAKQMILKYWGPLSNAMDKRDKIVVSKLDAFCTHFENETYRKDKASSPISWNNFKNYSSRPLQCMLESCGTPILERVAAARAERQKRRTGD